MSILKDTPYGPIAFDSEEQYQNFLKLRATDRHAGFFKDKEPIAHVRAVEASEGKVIGEIDEASAKQSMRRQGAIDQLVQQTLLTRVQPGTGANVEYISFETWRALSSQFSEAIQKKFTVDQATKDVGFQPLNYYLKKIHREQKDGTIKQVRPLLMNEVGIRPNGVILCLQDRMPGDVGTVVVGKHTSFRDPNHKSDS